MATISIITAIHNQLGMNRIFWESLKKYTTGPFELIVIDNNSTDGSREFFEGKADRVIANSANFSYPVCQNQGLAVAKGDIVALLNNDCIVSPGWDEKIVRVMDAHGLDVASFATNDHDKTRQETKAIKRKWKRIKYPLLALFGTREWNLKLMFAMMYGNWENWTRSRYEQLGDGIIEGYSGSCIMLKKAVIDKIGLFDERIQAADFDLFNRVKERSLEVGDIRPLALATGVYIHHYSRLTMKAGYEPFADAANLIALDEKWSPATTSKLREALW